MARALKSKSQLLADEGLEAFYSDVLDAMPHLVYLLDKNCMLTGLNRNFRHLLKLIDRQEIKGKSFYKLLRTQGHWSPERIDMLKRDDISSILSAEPIYNVEEAPIVNTNEKIVYYQSTRIPLFDKKNEVIGLVGILMDISEIKELKDQLGKIKNQLQSYNAQPKRDLNLLDNRDKDFERITPPKVLMVEDNSIAQKAAQALLMQLDCHVDVADTGDKATLLFEPGKYDLVFMDIGLQDTSGYVVSKQIRQLEKGTKHHVPIIALTGFEADVVKYDCDDYTMEGALTKPLTSEQARQIIQHYIYHIDIPVSGLKSSKS